MGWPVVYKAAQTPLHVPGMLPTDINSAGGSATSAPLLGPYAACVAVHAMCLMAYLGLCGPSLICAYGSMQCLADQLRAYVV